MFTVSDKYIQAVHSPSRESDIRGKIILNNGGVVSFTSKDLLQGSTTYSNSCLSASTFNLGACYIGEFKTTLKTSIDRYALYGGTIIVEFLLKIDSGEWEVVNVGTFTIASAVRMGNYVQIDSFDNMQALEAKPHMGTSGLPIELLTWICSECNVSNGMTSEMWAALANETFIFAFSANDYSTYRDLLSDLATLMGGFATVDQYGAIVIKPFKTTVVDTIEDAMRTESQFEDYVCKYTSVSIKIKGVQYSSTAEVHDGMVLTLADNKLAGANSPDQINTMLANIVEALKDVQYIPYSVKMNVNPAYELGDVVEFTGYNTGGTPIKSYVHSINWTFRNSMTISGVGENSKIANARSATDKAAANAGDYSQVEMKTLLFTNVRDVKVEGNRRAMLLDARFSATYNETSVPLLSGQFVANVEEPAVYRIIYELNGETLDFRPEEAVHTTGSKIFTFIKSLPGLSTDVANRLRIYLECSPLTVTTKELTKNESTGEYSLVDVETIYNGKATVASTNLNAILQSANLSFAVQWDGNFEIYEEYEAPLSCTKWKTGQVKSTRTIDIKTSDKLVIKEQTTCVYKPISVIAPPATMQLIMDYDAVPIYDLPYKELSNNSSDSGTLSSSSVVIIPETTKAGCCAPYYMQLAEGESTRITVTTDAQVQLYLINELTEDLYSVAIVGENNTIDYTSTGARFWLLIISSSRHENGAYTITSTAI